MVSFGSKMLIFDGAMGTMLQKKGLVAGEIPETYNIKKSDIICSIHKEYIDAGCDIITSNTFGCNEFKLKGSGFEVEEIIENALMCAKKARGKDNVLIAYDMGPTGELLEPLGKLSFEDAYNAFKRQVICADKSGCDLFLIETMTDLAELRAALLAVKENSKLPVLTTMSFEKSGRTFTGCLPESFAKTAEGLGADGVGVNCSLGPVELKEIVDKILKSCNLPVIVQANAGLPRVESGKTVFDIGEEEFMHCAVKYREMGVSVIGGCCGTTPSYIKRLSEVLKGKSVKKRPYNKMSCACTATKFVNIDRVRIVGERINPTGKKLLKEALLTGDMSYVKEQAISQTKDGASILDVNVGLPGINETKVMDKVMKNIASVTDIPLQIDSSDPEVIEYALRHYSGKAVVNSVNGEEKVLDRLLPIVKKYGASVIGLTMSDKGIPEKAEERLKIAGRIIEKAEEYGIKREDIFIDCLVLTASAQQEAVFETLKAVKMVKESFGVKTLLGVSNISFGLPQRGIVNEAFLISALSYGLDLPIMNPAVKSMTDAISAFEVLKGYDESASEYIRKYKEFTDSEIRDTDDLKVIIEEGLKEKAAGAVEKLMETENPFNIVDKYLIPALDVVGNKYEKGILFLPQLITSAETVKICVDKIKEKTKGETKIIKGRIILATVKGDVHDIGKNIVKIILENYGYEIIDLGRDISTEKILNAIEKYDVKLVGLSALMTTTVSSMEETVKVIKSKYSDVKVMVGGAVLTEDYAKSIGADYYTKDAKKSAEVANMVFKQ